MEARDLSYFDKADKPDEKIEDRLCKIEEELQQIQTLLKNIFGDHVLVGGKFVNIKNMIEPMV